MERHRPAKDVGRRNGSDIHQSGHNKKHKDSAHPLSHVTPLRIAVFSRWRDTWIIVIAALVLRPDHPGCSRHSGRRVEIESGLRADYQCDTHKLAKVTVEDSDDRHLV
jgi:hypothetical protein